MKIAAGNLDDPQVRSLVRHHLAEAHANSPPGSVFALDLSKLQRPGLTFLTAWEGTTLVGMGALDELDPVTGEIKSMRTHPDHLRKGVAAAIMDHLIAVARSRGYARLSLETGTGSAYDAATALYRRRGFVKGAAFGGYQASAFNQFFHLDLVS